MLKEWPDENRLEGYKGIYLEESDIITKLPEELDAPRLQFFLLHSTKRNLTIPNTFFKSSKELKLLAFTNMHFLLLPSLNFLQKLKALCLHYCVLEDIAGVRSLKKLKVLSLAYSEIERLPVELAELTFLQMLNLSHCSKLKVIPQKLLSSLKKLEALYMENSFDQWKVEGFSEVNENVSLDELNDLPISSLDIHIPSVTMLPGNLFLDMNLKRYRILIGKRWQWWQCNHENSKMLRLELEKGIHLKCGVQKLLEGVENLHLYESSGLDNILFRDEGRGFPYLRHLRIEDNDDIKCIVFNSAGCENSFPILETLVLQDLKALEKLCEGTNTIAFHQLRTLRMRNLSALTTDPWLKDGASNNISNKMSKSLFREDDQLSHNSLSNLKTLIVKECGFVNLVPLHVLKSLNNLEVLEIEQCMMLKMVFDFEDLNDYKGIESSSMVVPLKRLKLWGLPKLENVWSSHYQGNVSFPSLRSVDVSGCERLTSIFPPSFIVKGMLRNLEELRIVDCGIDVIVANDQASESVNAAFECPRLTSLRLCSLPKLRNLYPLEWSNLQRLVIKYCDGLEIFEKEVSGSAEIHEVEGTPYSNHPLLSSGQALLPKLETWELCNLNNLIPFIWDDQLSHNSLSNLKTLIVKECGFVKLVPLHVLKSLNNLEELEIEQCRMLKMVFDFEDLNDYEGIESSSVVVPLKKLKLENLPKLENVWSSHYQGNVSFPSLRSVDVSNCQSLTSIFPASSIAKSMLQNLEKLAIDECCIDVIVANDQASESAIATFKFPSLTSLEFYGLRKLRNFYPQQHTLEWPNLQQLSIKDCALFEIFEKEVSSSLEIHAEVSTLNSNHPLLSRDKVIYNFGKLRLTGKYAEMIGSGRFPMYHFPNVKRLHLSVDDGKWPISYKSLWKSFPNLEKLKLNGDFEVALETDDVAAFFSKLTLKFISNMRSMSPSLVSSQNLTHLQVSSSPELTTLMTSSTAQCLVHITHLSICYCYEMEEIITKQEGENDEDKEIIFNKLEVLQFDKMPKLKRFCGHNYTFRFPLLEKITMTRCPTFKIFSPGNIDTPSLKSVQLSKDLGEEHHEIWDTDLNKTFYKQRFVASREVVLDKEDASMIRNGQFPLESFPQVEILDIEGFVDECVTSLEIFPKLKQLHVNDCSFEQIFPSHTPSLASFHNLTKLKVSECHQLVYLVTNSTAKSLVNLETLEISACENLKEIVKKGTNINVEIESSSVVVPLKMLKLHRLPKLTNVWSSHNQGSVSLPSLRSIDVSKCESLTSIFPASSIAKGMLLNLGELRIDRCGINVIVANDQASESTTVAFKFPRLTTLEFRRLRKLRNFYPQRHTLEWPNLQHLSIEDCGELEIFEKEVSGSLEIHEEESTQNSNHPLLSCDQVIPNLEELELRGEQAMISHPFPIYQFPKVKMLSLSLYDGSTISYKSLWKSFPNLEQLQLHGDFEEALEMDEVAASFSTLTLSHIVNLGSLSPSLVSSQNLTYLQVTFCSQLTTLMTASTAQCLVHLTYLSISYCDEMEEIITKQEGENNEDKEIIFSKLKVLKFDEMLRLKRFCGYNYTFRFPLLEKIVMNKCSKFKIFSPGLIDTPDLKSVQLLEYWGGHNEIWDTNLSKTFYQQRFVASRELVLDNYDASMIRNDQFPIESCPQVQILDIEGFVGDEWLTFPCALLERFPKLKQFHVKNCSFEQIFPSHAPSLASFHNLTALKVSKCHQLVYLVTNSTAKSLVNLETLEISDCEKMEEIIKKESSKDVERGGIIFNRLRILKLDGLPRMKTEAFNIDDRVIGAGLRLLFDHNQVVLPKLEILALSYLLNNSISLIWDEQLLHNSFSNLKTLIVQSCGSLKSVPIHVLKSLNKLEKLQVSECDMLEMVFSFEDLNDSKVMKSSSVVVPLNLTHLEVESCQGLTTLMMSLAARRLVHLTHLSIRYCDQIKEIITQQEGDDEEDKEIVLSKLEILELIDLTRLRRFCSHNYTFSFSSLEHTTIRECPQLTMFCPGVVHAPLLKSIQVENGFGNPTDIWMTNLNDTIQHRFTIKEVIFITESMALNAENITMINDVFPKVEALYVEGFMDEGVTFPYSSLKRFPKLYSLFVEHCSFEEIFPSHDHITNDFMEEIPPFEQLRIAHLDKLKSIWKDDSQLPLLHQNLTSLEVESCCNLIKLAPSSASFQCLWEIKVYGCHQLIHLVTSSTAKSLVSLRRLEINDCKNMEAIVMNEINEDVEGKITFNRLWEIKFTNMPSLKMFSSQSHTLQFPKLYELKITGCPEMNVFCPGVLKTPKLSKVRIEEHDMVWKDEEELNKTVKMLSSAKEIVVNV